MSIRFDTERFMTNYAREFSAPMARQREGLGFLLEQFAADAHLTDVRHAAYMLATVHHETAFTYQPIDERGSRGYFIRMYSPNSGDPRRQAVARRLGNLSDSDAVRFKGAGFVQITGRRNYTLFGQRLSVDLVNQPERAKEPATAYQIMSLGMREGLFTGVGLRKYIAGRACDYVNARRIINGLDSAARIAEYAAAFERCLFGSLIEVAQPASAPPPRPALRATAAVGGAVATTATLAAVASQQPDPGVSAAVWVAVAALIVLLALAGVLWAVFWRK